MISGTAKFYESEKVSMMSAGYIEVPVIDELLFDATVEVGTDDENAVQAPVDTEIVVDSN